MYVIFPADEVVYLSYGRLIYLPPPPENHRVPSPVCRSSLSTGSHVSVPSISTNSSTRSHRSTSSFKSGVLKSGSSKSLLPTSNSETPLVGKKKLFSTKSPKVKRKLSFSDFIPFWPANRSSKEKSPSLGIQEKSGQFRRSVETFPTPPNRSPNLIVENSDKQIIFDYSQPSTSKAYLSPVSEDRPPSSLSCNGGESPNENKPPINKCSPKQKTSDKVKSAPTRKTSSDKPQNKSVSEKLKLPSEKTKYPSEKSKNQVKFLPTCDPNFLRENTPPTNSPREKSPPSKCKAQFEQKAPQNRFFFRSSLRDKSKTDKPKGEIEKNKNDTGRQKVFSRSDPVDFDSLFARDTSPGKTSSERSSQHDSPRTTLTQISAKPRPVKKSNNPPYESANAKENQQKARMASNEYPLKDLTHPGYNEHLKSHNAVTFKLVRTVADFTQQLGQLYEQHAEEIQLLVSNFRKRNGELRKERPACPSSLFHTWETLLQEVEIDSQVLGEIASILERQVSRPLLERSFHRKIQSRKVFTHRESYETILAKTEEKLAKCRQEYKAAYVSYLSAPSTETLSCYFNSHNAYVQQLHATNGMLEEYGRNTLPSLLQELEEIYTDLCSTITEAVIQGVEVVSSRASEQSKRYDGLVNQCKNVSGPADLTHLARSLPVPSGRGIIMKRPFVPPQPPPPPDTVNGDPPEIATENIPPPLKDELVIDRLSALQIKPSHDVLRKEQADLDNQIRQIQDALDTLVRIQQRSVEASLYNKANELQEDISMKRFDLHVAHIHLSAINGQKELFSHKLEGDSVAARERKMSNASTGSMKTKWLKAFKSLKTPPPEVEKKNGAAATRELLKGDPDAHNFQENTYKKITPCDVCSQVLRGHTRQGLKCRICKMNVHVDCQNKASKCQTKAKLLRRQKSTSEIETRIPEPALEEERDDVYSRMPTINRRLSIKNTNKLYPPPQNSFIEPTEVDQIYQVLKQATEISNSKPRVNVESVTAPGITVDRGQSSSAPGSSGSSGQSLNRRAVAASQPPSRTAGTSLAVVNPAPCSTSSDRKLPQGPSSSESSSMRRRLFAGMKSLTGFGSRSRHGSPGHRSISLPETPHSPRRQKLNLRMKSLSLDSPESTEHVQRRRHHGANVSSDPHSNQSSSSRIQFNLPTRPLNGNLPSAEKTKSTPSSPVHNRRLLSAKNIRTSSVELPDDNEKSPSSASTSPCPSPVGGKKSHRLLPTNLYVVLYNFKSRHQDELDLKAGYKVTVIDTSDPDWWKGKCLGRVGYFPSKYVSKLSSGEKPLQVTHNLQVSDGDNGLMLLRDQIVIQIGEELDGMVMIRSGDNRQGVCPVKFLQEV